MSREYKHRYVLAEGYPWAFGIAPFREIGMTKGAHNIKFVELDFPPELWMLGIPRYRLVLERVVEGALSGY